MFQYSLAERTVPVSVPGKRFRRFRFRVQFLGKRTVPTAPVSGSGSVPGPPCFESLSGVWPSGFFLSHMRDHF